MDDGLQIKSCTIKNLLKVLTMRGLTVKLVKIHVRKNRWKSYQRTEDEKFKQKRRNYF